MNNETFTSQVEIGARFDVSDHHEIRFKINAEIEQNTALVPDFRKANYQLPQIPPPEYRLGKNGSRQRGESKH